MAGIESWAGGCELVTHWSLVRFAVDCCDKVHSWRACKCPGAMYAEGEMKETEEPIHSCVSSTGRTLSFIHDDGGYEAAEVLEADQLSVVRAIAICLRPNEEYRLTHHVHILELNGESYRLKRSRDNATAQAPDDLDNP